MDGIDSSSFEMCFYCTTILFIFDLLIKISKDPRLGKRTIFRDGIFFLETNLIKMNYNKALDNGSGGPDEISDQQLKSLV